jgi:hypothetical protein
LNKLEKEVIFCLRMIFGQDGLEEEGVAIHQKMDVRRYRRCTKGNGRFMSREFSELSAKAPKELVRERTLPNGAEVKQWGPFVYGYSMTVGPDGRPRIREFGNIKPET